MFDEWSSYDRSLTKERLIEDFKLRSHSDKIPFTVVAFRNQKPIGTITLESESEPELSKYGINHPWLNLQVIKEERKSGIGEYLIQFICLTARNLGCSKVFVYTSDRKKAEWYHHIGGEIIEKEYPFRKHTVTILQFVILDGIEKTAIVDNGSS